jgi:long-chain acyl-CoA synthetase
METLLELLPRMRALGAREAIRYHNGYRTWKVSYAELYRRSGCFARWLTQRSLAPGDRVLLWGENCPEWVYVFWACLARGIEVVPLDYRFSAQLVERIQQEVRGRLLVTGAEVDAKSLEIEQVSFAAVADLATAKTDVDHDLEIASVDAADVVEIVYTSGTTGEPKGVVHRHRNIASNLTAIEKEIARYRGAARPFQPIRMLDLLPLSHMFGQSTGLFVAVMLEGAVAFTNDFSPGGLMEMCRRERISVLIGVPRMLANLRQEIERKLPGPVRRPRLPGVWGALESWLRYRRVHARLGWKFWALVVGGAPLGRDLEDFWRWLGFVVVQGYGMTEASPVIAVNHPFHPQRGSIGTALAGQEIRLAPDGEILVRGPSVVNEYFARPQTPQTAETQQRGEPADGWLHTGDIAEMDAEGHLYYRGRKKEVIVRPDGLNVYPQDVEAVLNRMSTVRESVVVAIERHGEERIHAAVILRESAAEAGAILDEAVRKANRQLEAHQRIQSWSLWPEEDFPRTASTMKVQRVEVARRVAAGPQRAKAPGAVHREGIPEMLAQVTGRDMDRLADDQRLEDDLALSSLERVELLARIENHYHLELNEDRFAAIATIGELRRWLRESETEHSPIQGEPVPGPPAAFLRADVNARAADGEPQTGLAAESSRVSWEPAAASFVTQPRWTRWPPVALARALLLEVAILPMVRELVRLKVAGLEQLAAVQPPVIFAANHTSHFDTAVIYCALPRRWRRRLAPAMSQDFFRALFQRRHVSREEFWKAAGQFVLASGVFNAFPLPQKMGGARRALRYTGELIDRGYCPLVFPEGERSETGRMLPFKSGIGLMARRLSVPVVPVYLEGVYEVYSVHHEWPSPGRVTVRFGNPLRFEAAGDYLQAAQVVERAVHEMGKAKPSGKAAKRADVAR